MFDFDVVTDEKTAPRRKAPPERRPAIGNPAPPRGDLPAPAALELPVPAGAGGKATL
jgi:hypothetical protein